MKSDKSKKTSIFGLVTVNDKGQVVIPAEARTAIEVESGDRLLVVAHPSKQGVILIKPDGLESYANEILKSVSDVRKQNKA